MLDIRGLVPLLLALSFSCAAQPPAPDIFLLKRYDSAQHTIDGWLMSEKLDGIRAIWTGRELITRSGMRLQAPDWFTDRFPPFALDGELWTKHNDFENISSVVRTRQPDRRWETITYHIFEVPHQPGGLLDRLQVLEKYLDAHPQKYIRLIPQIYINDEKDLQKFLQKVIAKGGEGVVVRQPLTPYYTGRSSLALKVKHFQDADCVIMDILSGKGKYSGMMGSLQCQMPDGKTFKIGSGFTEEERRHPLPIGTIITYKYYGFTRSGIPKFASFLRVREQQ